MAETVVRDVVRVSVHVRDRKIDVSVSSRVPLSRLAREIAADASAHLDKRNVDSSWMRNPGSELVLGPVAGVEWEQSETLATYGVVDGDSIVLSTRTSAERFPALIESMADATAQTLNRTFLQWDADMTERTSAWFVPVAIALLSLAGAGFGFTRSRVIMAGLVGALALIVVIVAMVSKRSALTSSVYVPATVAALMAPPGWGVWNVVAAIAMMLTLSVIFVSIDSEPRWLHVAAGVPAVSATVGGILAGAYNIWRDVSPAAAACVIATVAMLALYSMPSLSRGLAHISMPDLSEMGTQAMLSDRSGVIEQARKLSMDGELEPVFHQHSRNIEARYIRIGLLAGAAVTVAGAAVVAAIASAPRDVRYLVWSVDERTVIAISFAVLAAIFILRGTWYRDRGVQLAGLVAGSGIWAVYLIAYSLATPDTSWIRMVVMWAATALLLGFVLMRVWVSTRKPTVIVRKWMERAESLLYVIPIINLVAVVNVFFHVRHL